MKEHEKLGQKQVSKVTLHFVLGHFSRKQTVQNHDGSMVNDFFVLCFQETFRNCADIQIFSNAPTGFVPNGIDSPYVPYAPPSAIYVLKRTRNGQALRIPFIVRHQVKNFGLT